MKTVCTFCYSLEGSFRFSQTDVTQNPKEVSTFLQVLLTGCGPCHTHDDLHLH